MTTKPYIVFDEPTLAEALARFDAVALDWLRGERSLDEEWQFVLETVPLEQSRFSR